jgi:transcriptional regulator with XRE-family HTH domain
MDKLTKDQILKLQSRLHHYLKSYELEEGLSSSKVAERLGYSQVHYWRIREEVDKANKVIKAYETLKKFASLKNLSVVKFLNFLEGHELQEGEASSWDLKEWETNLIRVFRNFDIKTRRIFTRKVIRNALEDERLAQKLDMIICCSNVLFFLEEEEFETHMSLIKVFAKQIPKITEKRATFHVKDELKSKKNSILRILSKFLND